MWSLDEVHFQQYGSRCRMWVPPETQDPILLHHPGRASVGYFGAVRLRARVEINKSAGSALHPQKTPATGILPS